MKKKKLLKKIFELNELNDLLESENIWLMMRLGDFTCDDPNMKPCCPPIIFSPETIKEDEANGLEFFTRKHHEEKLPKTEGPESESELKENECPYKIGDKWEAKNGEILTMQEYNPNLSPDVHCVFKSRHGIMGYSVNGIACGEMCDWDLVSKAKE